MFNRLNFNLNPVDVASINRVFFNLYLFIKYIFAILFNKMSV